MIKLPEESNNDMNKSNWKKVLSPSVNCLAEHSRTHSSRSLMNQGIRHVMDKAAPSIFEGHIGTASCKNEMVLKLSNQVKPSMNQGLFQKKI